MLKAHRPKGTFSLSIFVGSTAVSAGCYSLLFYELIRAQDFGVFLMEVPLFLVASLILSSSVLFAFAVENFVAAYRARSAAAAATSAGTFAIGVTIVGCACSAPLLASALYLLGANALQVSSVLVLFGDYQSELVELLILLNLAMVGRRVWQLRRG